MTRILVILGAASLVFALGPTTVVVAFPELMQAFHTDASGVAWTVTGYLVAAAVLSPIVGRLGDMFGKRRMLILTLVAFAAGSLVAAQTDSLWVVVASRVVQGVGGGIFPLSFGIIRDEFPARRAHWGIGLITAIAGIGGGLGIFVGGLLVDYASYHWVFFLGAPIGFVLAAAVLLCVPASRTSSAGRVDIRGAAVLAVGLVMPLIAISQAPDRGWGSSWLLLLAGAGVVVLAAWVVLERRTDEPFADVAALAKPSVLAANFATFLIGFGIFGSFIALPQLEQAPPAAGYGFGVDATTAGLMLLPGSLAMLLLGPLSGPIGSRLGNKVPLIVGSVGTACGLGLMAVVHGSKVEVIALSVLIYAGGGLAFGAMSNLIVDAVPRSQTGEATGFNALVRFAGAALGAQVTATILAGSAVAGNALPRDRGYTQAFLVSSGVVAFAALAGVLMARGGHHGVLADMDQERGVA